MFDGVSAYRLELQVLGVVAFAAIGVPIVSIIWRYGHGVDASSTDITKGDWWTFRKGRKFIGQAANDLRNP